MDEAQSIITENTLENSEPENVSVQEKLQMLIDASLKNPQEISQKTLSLPTLLKYELTIAGKRGNLLEEVYQMLVQYRDPGIEKFPRDWNPYIHSPLRIMLTLALHFHWFWFSHVIVCHNRYIYIY